jgi:hypothetical protein
MDKGRQTWKENLEREHPELVGTLKDQRLATAKQMISQAESSERSGDFLSVRQQYAAAVEAITQYNTLTDGSVASIVEAIKEEYKQFVLERDPLFKNYIDVLLPIIKANPGILQTDLYAKTTIEKSDVGYCLYFADAGGLVKREKKGRTYQLSII